MAGTTVSYAAAFPVGLLPTNENDTGLSVQTTSVDAFDADGAQLDPTALGDPNAFTGNGYMLMGLEITGAGGPIPRRVVRARRTADGGRRADAPAARTLARMRHLRGVGAGAARLVAGTRSRSTRRCARRAT